MKLRSDSHRLCSGYTLVEMLVGIGILSIAGMILVPNLVDRGTFAIQAAARSIVSDIVFAQSDALANQEYRRFQFIESPEGQSGYVGYCVLRVSPESFSYPYDPNSADYVSDPLGTIGNNGRYIIDFSQDDRFEGVVIESVDLDSGLAYTTFDEYGGSVSSSGGVPGIGGTIDLVSQGSRYRVTVSAFTAKTTVEVLSTP
jgi:prepilin-type N-terminal cleavage/methylation domain-containing protein